MGESAIIGYSIATQRVLVRPALGLLHIYTLEFCFIMFCDFVLILKKHNIDLWGIFTFICTTLPSSSWGYTKHKMKRLPQFVSCI